MSDTSQPKVTIYSTTWCAFCKTERQWLDHLGVAYDYKNIEEDEAAHNELIAKTDGNIAGVPITDIGGDIILGFDRPKLQAALTTHGLLPQAA